MFQEEYQKAYNKIEVPQLNIGKLRRKAEERGEAGKKVFRSIRMVAAPVLSLCLICVLIVPVVAREFPAVYRVIQKYAPALADYVLQEELQSTSQEITLQMEAVNIKDNSAEIILSFRDAEGSAKDLIKGKVDLYDSYRIRNYGETSVIGGCSFLKYDASEDKAYFQIKITSDKDFSESKVKFEVDQLLTSCVEEEQFIDLTLLNENPKEKLVEVNGVGGGLKDRSRIPFFAGNADGGRSMVYVMDEVVLQAELLHDLQITGIAYEEGVLRVQQCRGNFADADRHIRLYMKDVEGNERIPDMSVNWQEEIRREKVLFDETWFLISEKELQQYELYGMFCVTDQSVKGDWDIVFDLER